MTKFQSELIRSQSVSKLHWVIYILYVEVFTTLISPVQKFAPNDGLSILL